MNEVKGFGVCVIGGGPAGLMAAEVLSAAGVRVVLCDAMPSVGRKFLLAGRGGLNLTHSEPLPAFIDRYGDKAALFASLLADFGPDQIRQWASGLGIDTFVGTSGRVFPAEFKAAPLLRAWVRRLRERGVDFRPRHRWEGFGDDGALRFATPDGPTELSARATVLALGGGSWPQLGSDGSWIAPLASLGCRISPLRPANCGFLVSWSSHMENHFGCPLKAVALRHADSFRRGEVVLTDYGLEGSALYALGAGIRDAIDRDGRTTLLLDLKPDLDEDTLAQRLLRPRGRASLSTWLKKAANLPPVAAALLREVWPPADIADPPTLARRLKTLPILLTGSRPLTEAISTAGGLAFEEVADDLMLRRRPGVFVAGEMLDWEAPTGGYLLTGCMATGWRAGHGALGWINSAVANQAP